MERKYSKDYFKRSSVAMGLLYAVMGCVLGYCLMIMFLPNVVKWIFIAILEMLKDLSLGDESWYLFNQKRHFS